MRYVKECSRWAGDDVDHSFIGMRNLIRSMDHPSYKETALDPAELQYPPGQAAALHRVFEITAVRPKTG